MVFPTEETEDRTPVDYVAKGSDVITGIECKYIWVGAKGWGVTWALKQCAVKPKEIEVTEGLLQLDLGPKSANAAAKVTVPSKPVASTVQETDDVEEVEEEKVTPAPAPTPTKEPMVDNYVEDSDTEEVAPVATAAAETQEEEEPEKVEEEEKPAPVAKKVVKKSVVKKAPAKEEADATATEEEAKPAPKVVKKVVRKKV